MGGNRLVIRGDVGQGSMPFNAKGHTCYYNGEIYNFNNLGGIRFSDGEIILPTFRKHGLHSFRLFEGEYAISIWDPTTNSLILARDPFGTKPLYFSLSENLFIYGSSESVINAIRPHQLCKARKSKVYEHTLSVQEPYTSFDRIWTLPPGCLLIINDREIRLLRFNNWTENFQKENNPKSLTSFLKESLHSRLNYQGTIGIPLSGGIDSGIIAFTADKLNIKYDVFSVVEMNGFQTDETEAIYKRVDKLKNVNKIHLLKCNDAEIDAALEDIYKPDYYCSEKFDTSCIPTHTVMKAMKLADIKVAVDGTGGDEIFDGYLFRNDFSYVKNFPKSWKEQKQYYSIFTTLLDYTAKVERAGAHFSIETRFPYQNTLVMNEASSLCCLIDGVSKKPLREFLIKETNYGSPTPIDINGKFGFSLKNINREDLILKMKKKWLKVNCLEHFPKNSPTPFPFRGIRNI